MDVQEILSLVSRWMHILFAIALVGGTIFIRFALVPARRQSTGGDSGDDGDTFGGLVYRRWSRIVMVSIGMLLISGIYNTAIKMMQYDAEPLYHSLLGIKMLLAFAVFGLASVLAGRSALAQRLRARERTWLNLNLLMMISVVCLAGFLKQMDPPRRGQAEREQTEVPAQTETP